MTLEFKKLPDYGDLLTLEDFLHWVEVGLFTDYDGTGDLATDDECSNIEISPSEVAGYDFPDWCTHIVWYNR